MKTCEETYGQAGDGTKKISENVGKIHGNVDFKPKFPRTLRN
jgi:hypothetical protein